jgi:hypothetical protein
MFKTYPWVSDNTNVWYSAVLPPATTITEVTVNGGAVEAFSSENLLTMVTPSTTDKLIYNWQVDKGSGFESVKIIDMPMDGGTLASGGKVKNYCNNIHGVVQGASYKSDGGFDGKGCFEFDGVDDAIYIEDNDIIDLTNDFTISLWVNPAHIHGPEMTKAGVIFRKDDAYEIYFYNGKINLRLYLPGITGNPVDYNLELNRWSYITMTYKDGTLKGYINGELKSSKIYSGNINVNTNNLCFGRYNAGSFPFEGKLDEVKFFNRVLSGNQIATMYNNCLNQDGTYNGNFRDNIIVSHETRTGEKWKTEVIPNDNTSDGDATTSNEVLIKFPQITGTTINSGDTEAFSSDNLLNITTPDHGNGAKMISDWQVDDGSGFESIKIIDMPFDGGDFNTSGRIVDYISGIESYLSSNITYESDLGFDGKGCYKFNSSSIKLHNDVRDKIISLSGNSQTISLWIKTESNGKIYSYYGCSIGDNTTYYLDLVNNKLLFFIADSDGNESILEYANGLSFMDGSWHNVITTYKTGGDQEIYVDGDLIASKPMGTFNGFTNSESIEFNLGVRKHCNNSSIQPFDGYIDDFKVYKRALSQKQIEAMFNNCLNPDGSYNGNFRDNIIAPEETKTGEKWRVTVTPNDNVGNGDVKNSNEILIKFPQITGVTINDGATEAFSGNNLLHTTTPDFGNRAKMISDWQVDNGSGFKSVKILDMPMDGGALEGGKVKNYSGNIHGTILGGEYKPDGGFDGKGCFEFDGIDDGIYIEDNDIVDIENDFTISLWINPAHIHGPDGSKAGVILRKGDAYEIFYRNSKVNLRIHTPHFNENTIDYDVAINRWSYITMTYKDGILKGYINGVLRSNNIYSGNVKENINNLCFGRYNAGDYPFKGKLDEIMFFNRALSSSQIVAMYNNCLNQDGTYNGNFRDNIIAPQETKTGEKWKVTVTPNDNVSNGDAKTSNEVLIKFPQITGVTINSGNTEASSIADLIYTTTPDFVNRVKMITDWQIKGVGESTFESIKIFDMPMDGGTIASGGEVKDYINDNNAEVKNGAEYLTNGGIDGNGAYKFDGSNDYLVVSDPSNGSLELGTGDFTVSFWVKWLQFPSVSTEIFEKSGSVHFWDIMYSNHFGDGNISMEAGDKSGGERFNVFTTSSPFTELNKWYNVVITKNSNGLKFVVNGVKQTTTVSTTKYSTNLNVSAPLYIGKGSRGYINAVLDEISIYKRALSVEQAIDMYNNFTTTGVYRNDIMSAMETKTGEAWKICVTPSDNVSDGTELCSNTVAITAPAIDNLKINGGDTEATTIEQLISEYANKQSFKGIHNWQVDKGDGNGFQSIKVLDMPMDRGALAGGDVKNYASNNNGVVHNAKYRFDSGFDNKGCYAFNGTSDYIAVSDDTENRTDGSFTAMVWVYITGAQDEYPAFITAESSYEYYSWTLRKNKENNKVEFAIGNRLETSNGYHSSALSDDDLTLDKWQHVIVVWNQDKKSATLYMNGEESGTSIISNITRNNHNEGFKIGKSDFTDKSYFKGFLDDVKVYNRVLSSEQISAMYNNFETTRVFRDDIIVPQETKSGEVWKTCVTPNDNFTDGTELCSNSITITIPTIENLKINEGDSEAVSSDELIAEYVNMQSIKGVFNWQIDKNDGNGFRPIKAFDMSMDGGALVAGGKIRDYANDNHATPNGVTYKSEGGYDGKGAYHFDGIDDYISIPHSSNVNIGALQEYTINFWVYLYQTGDWYIASKGNAQYVNMWFILVSDKSVEFRYRNVGTSDDLHMLSAGNLPSKTGWINVTISYDSSGKYRIYRDGSKVKESIAGRPHISSNSSALELGVRRNHSVSYFRSIILDEFVIYNRALSEKQISVMYNNYETTGKVRNNIITPQETVVGEKWRLEVTANDNINDGINVLSNEIEIIFPKIDKVTLNNEATTVYSSDSLKSELHDNISESAKYIYNWQVDKSDGNGFKSIKVVDIPMDGGMMGGSVVKNYMNTPDMTLKSGHEPLYNAIGGFDGNGAFEFNGNNWVEIADDPLLKLKTYTISTWIKISEIGRWQQIITKERFSAEGVYNQNYSIHITDADKIRFRVENDQSSSGSDIVELDSDVSIEKDKWYNVVGVFDDENDRILIYINGNLSGTKETNITPNYNSNQPVRVGMSITNSGSMQYHFFGTIDELKIYNIALSAEQIKFMYNNYTSTNKDKESSVLPQHTKAGEKWRVTVTPLDNNTFGDSKTSNEVLVSLMSSCKAYKEAGYTENGVYEIDPDGQGSGEPFNVWCDMTSNDLEFNVESSNTALKSCTQHLALYSSNAGKDAIYLIDPDGVNQGKDPFKLWCDMTTDGGGWGLISYLDDEDNSANRWALFHDADDTGLEVGSNATSFDASFRTINNKLLIEMADEIAIGVPFKDDALVNGFRKLDNWTWAWKLEKPDELTSEWIDNYGVSNHLISSVNYAIINQPQSGSDFTDGVQNIYYGKKGNTSRRDFMLAEEFIGDHNYFYPDWRSCQETPMAHIASTDTEEGNRNGVPRALSKSTSESVYTCKLSGIYKTYEYHTNTRAIGGSLWTREDITGYYAPEVSCAAHKELGRSDNGVYKIDPDGEGGIEPFTAYCDMTSIDLTTDSESSSTALESCMQHLVYYPDNYTVDGVYVLDPDGTSGSEEPFKVWCDMTREGGGWTHTASLADDQNNYWTWNNQANLYNGNEYGQLNAFRTNDYQSKAWSTVSGNQIMFSHGVNNRKYIIYNDIINDETLNSKYTSSNTTVGEFGPPVVTEGTWWQQRGTELKMHLQVPDSDGHGWAMGGKSFVWRSTANHNSNYDDVFGGTSGAHNPDKEFWAPEHYFFYERNFDASALTVYVRENSLTTAYPAEKSCQHHYLKNRRVNGVYKIDPDDDGDIAEFEAYCDMNTDGGGWTLVHKNNRGNGADNDKTDNGYNTEALSDPVINDVAILPKSTIEALGETFRIKTNSDTHKMYWRFNSMSDVYYSSRMDDASEPVDLSVNYKLNWSSDWSAGKIDPTNTGTDSHSFVVWTEKDNTDKAHMIVSRNSGSGSSFWFNGDSWSYEYKPGAVWVKNSLLLSPEITYFKTNKNRIERGDDIQLSWSVPDGVTTELYSDTDSNYQNPKDVSSQDSENLTPDSDKAFVTYTLRVTDSDGFISKKKVKIFLDREIPYSLRFNSSESNYLRRENTESGNSKKWTYSVWVKLGDRDVEGTNFRSLFSSGKIGEPTEGSANLYINNTGNLCFYASNDHSNTHADYISTDKIESISEWTHIFVIFNSTEAEEGNRFKAYVNGTEVNLTSSQIVSENMELVINKEDYMHSIGVFYRNCTSENCDNENNSSIPGGGTDYYPHLFDGYMTEIYFIDGQSLSINNFGESKSGKWIPKATSVPDYGNNGFYINFYDQTNPGADYSGNGNDWLLINYITRKDGDRYIDQMLDSPDRNFAIVDVGASRDTYEISNGNLQAYSQGSGTGNATAVATTVLNNKSYWEVKSYETNNCNVGVEIKGTDLQRNYSSANGYQFYNGYKRDSDKNASAYGDVVNTGDYVGVAFDISTYMIWFAKLNQWQAGGDPENGTGSAFGGISTNNYLPSFADMGASNEVGFNINFGQGGQTGLKNYKIDITTGVWTEITDNSVPDARFIYAPPTGYYPLSDAFISPDISSFTANPTEVNSGGTTDLTWSVTGSVKEELWLDGEKIADITGLSPYTITPPEEPGEYTYTLKTYSVAGLVSTKEVKITVTPGVSVESVQINDNNSEYRSNQRLEAVHTGLNPADGNLIYNWFVDRGSGSNTIADVIIPFDGNTVNDQSGNNNNGTLHDNESDGYNSNGKYGVGYEFDGDNDYIEMPTIGNLFNSDFSYSIWVYIPSEARTEDVSFFNVRNFDDNGAGDHRAGHIVLQSDDNIRFECKGEGDNVLLEKTKNLSITKDVYLHFVVTKRGNEFRFYYNGEEQPDMRITTSGSTAIDDNNISIGRLNSNTVTEYFKGRVDELMIFNRALSSNQIKSVYDNGMRYIVPSETRVTDKWQVKVIPSDGTTTGEEKQSQQVTITASRRRLIVVETQ